ncbi:unnamed protein product [Didymodactylos carnosus]|uniref:LIM and SH3 domain protein Lasp n=1 Tax=Didymodactylos carnosus TaxID=1234261 RepID=A0A814BW13_9BILA|nr:unnamed protein product [Didymodactylos carnosus]CAF0933494.1 unnamed protein product [Didymodactylos carnosus]CAF3533345.1 unnamed protein product [Didymodactylos carnosus]CAF3711094.1 unnamed protein product [Didymodactylos carnosus]
MSNLTSVQKKCGKCEKVVYPTEELKCLDKFWHKACFKCSVCGMTLNVKNVKGYEKLPYCNVHYPQQKPTVVVDNPEMQRIKQLTDIQSNVKYHEDFNKNKGKFTAVSDDPATIRAKEHQRVVSQAEYTGKRKDSSTQLIHDNQQQHHPHQTSQQQSVHHYPVSSLYQNGKGGGDSTASVGRVADYDPLNDDRGSLMRGYEPTSKALHATKFEPQGTNKNSVYHPTMISSSNINSENGGRHQQKYQDSHQYQQQNNSNNNHHHHEQKYDHEEEHHHHSGNSHVGGPPSNMKVRALYNYEATESDEISFNEGDLIVECEEIDAGWMVGKHNETKIKGLLPSNYVEIIE